VFNKVSPYVAYIENFKKQALSGIENVELAVDEI
jgi:hypothetical protein